MENWENLKVKHIHMGDINSPSIIIIYIHIGVSSKPHRSVFLVSFISMYSRCFDDYELFGELDIVCARICNIV